MADVTGGTPPTNASAFAVPADIAAVYAHFGGPTKYTYATIASLPASGNWTGRRVYVAEDASFRVWSGSAWVSYASDGGTVTISTFSTNWSATVGYEPYIRVTGKRRDIFGAVNRAIGGSLSSILTIPAGHRPPANVFINAGITSTATFFQPIIDSAGLLQVNAAYSNSSAAGVYPLTGSWYVS